MPLTPAERNSLIERYAAGPARLRGGGGLGAPPAGTPGEEREDGQRAREAIDHGITMLLDRRADLP